LSLCVCQFPRACSHPKAKKSRENDGGIRRMHYSLVGDSLEWNARIKPPTEESYEVQMGDNSLLLRWEHISGREPS
jgi:hypothetical protein